MKQSPFSFSAVLILVAAALALFSLSVLLSAREDPHVSGGRRAGPGAFSSSAIGYSGLYGMLERLGWRVERDTGKAGADGGAVLVVAEPDFAYVGSAEERRANAARRLLLVLPKWRGSPDPKRSAWLGEAEPTSRLIAERTLAMAAPGGRVVPSVWPQFWSRNNFGVDPSGSGRLQLMHCPALTPLIVKGDAMLAGELKSGRRHVIVLSDPDIMANHGVGGGDNAHLLLALLERLSGGETRRVVFDETIHGFRRHEGSPLRLLFRFPYGVVTVLAWLAAILMALAGYRRFGPPLRRRPALGYGKAGLINNSARLMEYAGHRAEVLKRYVGMVVRDAGRSLHAPAELGELDMALWIDRVGKARGVGVSGADIVRRAGRLSIYNKADLPRLFECARAIHRWKGEVTHGTGANRPDGGGDAGRGGQGHSGPGGGG